MRARSFACAIPFAALLVLGGCSQDEPTTMSEVGETADEASETRVLAVEHSVSMDVPEPDVRSIHDRTIAACQQAPKGECIVFSSRLEAGEEPDASLSLRATPKRVRALIADLQRQGDVTSVSTQATDLAKPVADAERTAAMLASYRAKLEELAARAGNDADTLIKVHRELADVQSRIEANAGEREHLRKQVEMEVLRLDLSSEGHVPFLRPISKAFREFGADLSQGIAGAVTAVAVLLPGAVILAGIVAAVRRWRRRRAA